MISLLEKCARSKLRADFIFDIAFRDARLETFEDIV